MEITFDRSTVGAALQQRYTVPAYQRDYKWEVKHLQELLVDIQEAFLDNHKSQHGRQDVASYSPYFLGTIITTTTSSGLKAIVDGQQRLTTLVLLVSYFSRMRSTKPELEISNIDPLLRRSVFGQQRFNIDFADERAQLFGNILDVTKNPVMDILVLNVDTIPNLTQSSKRIFELFLEIDNFS